MSDTLLTELLQKTGLPGRRMVVARNEFVTWQGTVDTNLYLVESGSLRVYMLEGAEERIVRFGYPGDMITPIDSFLTGRPTDLFILAIRKTAVLVWPRTEVLAFIQSDSRHLSWWNTLLEGLVLQQLEREKDLLIQSPRLRYERVLRRSPQLFQEIPHRHIAGYLRMTPETLSRLKKS